MKVSSNAGGTQEGVESGYAPQDGMSFQVLGDEEVISIAEDSCFSFTCKTSEFLSYYKVLKSETSKDHTTSAF